MLMSEIVTPSGTSEKDTRGDVMNNDLNYMSFCYTTQNTPNTSAADVFASCVGSGTLQNAPCSTGSLTGTAARSCHTGGVQVMLADGSVRFVSNNLSLSTWQAIGTMSGNEIVGEF